ncbi:unnamed protein product, partial [Didymodactylos carnosus]
VDNKDIVFLLNDNPLSSEQSKRLKIERQNDNKKLVLTLKNIKLNVDQGDYAIKINPFQLQSESVHVNVNPKSIEVIQPLKQEKDVFENDTLILTTILKNVDTKPTIVWLRNGEPIPNGPTSKRVKSIPSSDGQQFKLTIDKIQLDESGIYALKINDQVITDCEVTVKQHPLKVVQPLKIIGKQLVNEKIELVCEINRSNVPCVWLKDNEPLEDQPEPSIDGKYRLKLDQLKIDDSGEYTIRFNDGELEQKVNVKIEYPPYEFIQQLKCIPSDEVEENEENLLMQCVLNRPLDDTVKIELFKNNKPVPVDNEHISIEKDGPSITVRFQQVKLDDAGTYKVTVDKTKETTTRLKVKELQLKIVEQLHLVDNDSNEIGETNPFEMSIKYNKPVKSVVLNKDGKRVPTTTDKHVQISYEDDNTTVRIQFDKAVVDDKGKYETVVRDSTISDKDGLKSSSLTITVKPLPILFTSDINVSSPNKDNIPEKSDVILTTTINQPNGKVKWFLNDKEIKEDQQHKITVNGQQRQLTLKATIIGDSGIYSARTDDDERTVELTIKEQPKPKIPRVIDGPKSLKLTEEEPLKIQLTVVDAPDDLNELSWSLNGKPISIDGIDTTDTPYDSSSEIGPRRYIYQEESDEPGRFIFTLEIPSCSSKLDAGNYTFHWKNDTKTPLASIKVDIVLAPLKFTIPLEPVYYVKEDATEPLVIRCEINRDQMKAVWTKGTTTLKSNVKDGPVLEQNNREFILKYPQPKKSDAGTYTIKIENLVGETKIEYVEQEITFTKPLTPDNVTITEGTEKQIDFFCETSKPVPVVWFHDDQDLTKLTPQQKKHYQIDDTNSVHKLRILQPVCADSGLYRCVIKSNNNETNSQCTIEPVGIDFVQPLATPVIADYNKTTVLECELTKRPQKVVWTKNGEPIEDSDKYEIMNNGKLQGLVINDCDDDDTAKYTITVDDKKSCSADVTVEHEPEKVKSPSPVVEKSPTEPESIQENPEDESEVESIVPEITSPFNKSVFRRPLQKALSVHEGNDFILECEVNDESQPTDWFLDDEKIMPDNEHFEIIENGPIRKLKVHQAELNDSGRYTCVDRQTEEKTSTDVDVIEAPIKIIKPLPETLTITQVELSHPNVQGCRFVRYDNKDEQQVLRKDKRTKLSCEGVKFTVVLDSLLPNDAGVYEFLGPNNLQSKCQVIVKAHPSKITQPLKDLTLQENQNLTLEARVDNEHAPISWFFNGQELKSDQHTTILSKGRRHTLVVQKVNMQDAGQYEIRTPDDKSACQVTVEPLDGVEFSKQLTIRPNEDISEMQTVELVCETNKDNVLVEWSKNGKPCDDQRLKIQVEGRVHSITIDESNLKDQGVYTCKIKSNNKATTATLKIKEIPVDFTQKMEPIDAIKGDTVTFECQLNKPNMSVKWLKENKPLTMVPGRFEATTDTDDDRNHLLTIHNTDMKDEGMYTCVIDNTTPSKKCSASLTVKSVTLELAEPLKDITINETDDLVLKFSVSHDVKQIANWKLDGRPIKPDERVQIEQDGKMHFLTIKNIQLNEKGKYTAQLANIETSCKVTVKNIPIKVVKDLYIVDDEQPIENQSVTLEIQLNKPLESEIILLKDGINVLKPKNKIPARVQATHIGNGTYQFKIDNLQPNDSGLYEVPVTPNLKSSLTLQVHPKQEEEQKPESKIEEPTPVKEVEPVTSEPEVEEPSLEEEQTKEDVKPQETQDYDFTIPLKGIISLNDNEPLHLECTLNCPVEELTAKTPEAIVWLRNGKPLTSDRVKTNANGNNLTLDIDNVKMNEDDGKYTLRLPNGKQCSVQVEIKPLKTKKLDTKSEISIPLHILLEKDRNEPWDENIVSNGPTNLGESIVLRCRTS